MDDLGDDSMGNAENPQKTKRWCLHWELLRRTSKRKLKKEI